MDKNLVFSIKSGFRESDKIVTNRLKRVKINYVWLFLPGGKEVSNLKHYIEGIKNGDGFFDEAFKLNFILNTFCVVNAIYAILFFVFDYRYMGVAAVALAMLYQLLRLLVQKGQFRLIIHLSYMEIWIFAFVNEVIFGREASFAFLIVATIPAIFYFALTWGVYKRKETASFALSLFAMFLYVLLYVYDIIHPGPLAKVQDFHLIVFTFYNYAVSFLAFIGFLMLLHWEMASKNTSLSSRNQALDLEANKDSLTGLYNRRYMNVKLDDKLRSLQEEGRIFGLIICDIDNFKRVNDTFGHESGDDVLVNAARVLMSSLRENDVVCRWGGEEFLIAIDGNKRVTVDVAERIRGMIEDMVVVSHGYTIKITMTFGVCESTPGLSIEKLVDVADERLYKGKQNGKNQVVSE